MSIRTLVGLLAALLLAFLPHVAASNPSPAPSATPCTAESSDPDERLLRCPADDPLVAHLFALAKQHDVAGVMRYGQTLYGPTSSDASGQVPDATAARRASYELALYAADPARFADRYVPAIAKQYASNARVLLVLYELDDAGLLPSPNFAFDIIQQRSNAGDATAMAVVLRASTHATNDFDPGLAWSPIVANPAHLLAAFTAMGANDAARFLCTQEDLQREPGWQDARLARLRPIDAAQRATVEAIRRDIHGEYGCASYDANS